MPLNILLVTVTLFKNLDILNDMRHSANRFEELTDEAFPVYRAISRVIFHVKRFGVSNLIFTRSALFRFNLGAPIIIAEDVNLCESEREQF